MNKDKQSGDQFYAFHNARLFDSNEQQVASLGEPLFISVDTGGMSEDELENKSKEMAIEYGFSGYIKREEEGKTYAVFQMFDDYEKAASFLRSYTKKLGGEWEEALGIFEQITEGFETDVETKEGVVKMVGKFVDNYYLKVVRANAR